MSDTPLIKLRAIMKATGVDAFVVFSGDAHQSEYVSKLDSRREYISNFTGSAGTALVLQDSAYLWTDGRYFTQAGNELSSSWTLMKQGQPKVLELNDWIVTHMHRGQVVGVDALLIPNGQAADMKERFEKVGISLVAVAENPIDKVWIECGRPVEACNPIVPTDITKTGKSHEDKIAAVQAFVSANNAAGLLVTLLDDIAWLLNIRGNDVEYNPVALCYALVTLNETYLFIDLNKVTDEVRAHFGPKVVILPYENVRDFLVQFATTGRVIMDITQVNWSLYTSVGDAVMERSSPIVMMKSLKNAVELEGFRQCHIRDGAALTAFFHWLEKYVKSGGVITEHQVTERIEEFRCKMKYHKGPSFGTIAGYGANGAMMHYSPSETASAVVGTDSMFLCDSGAQYLDGTTDVTR